MHDVPAFIFSTCICTNFNFFKTFLISDVLPHCILIKGNSLCKDISGIHFCH